MLDFTMSPMTPDRIAVVLSRPSHPGNIGSASRALKTMGFADLRLVEAPALDEEAKALAAGAADVLEAARRYDTLEAAIADCGLAVAFTARARGLSRDAAPIRDLAPAIVAAAGDSRVALVFGNETSGLSNDEIGRCQRIASIPANPGYSSLNLAAAVQVACYEVSVAAGVNETAGREPFEAATGEDLEALYEHFERSMVGSGYLDRRRPGRLMERLRRLFGRTRLERSEVKVLRGMLEAFERKTRP
jgi:tRNA/rRNA methyltransferase